MSRVHPNAPEATGSSYRLLSRGGGGPLIRADRGALRRLEMYVRGGLTSKEDHIEVGGVVLGSALDWNSAEIVISGFVPVATKRRFDSSLRLSDIDIQAFKDAAENEGPRAIGYFRSHLSDDLSARDEDARLIGQLFSKSDSCFFLIYAGPDRPSNVDLYRVRGGGEPDLVELFALVEGEPAIQASAAESFASGASLTSVGEVPHGANSRVTAPESTLRASVRQPAPLDAGELPAQTQQAPPPALHPEPANAPAKLLTQISDLTADEPQVSVSRSVFDVPPIVPQPVLVTAAEPLSRIAETSTQDPVSAVSESFHPHPIVATDAALPPTDEEFQQSPVSASIKPEPVAAVLPIVEPLLARTETISEKAAPALFGSFHSQLDAPKAKSDMRWGWGLAGVALTGIVLAGVAKIMIGDAAIATVGAPKPVPAPAVVASVSPGKPNVIVPAEIASLPTPPAQGVSELPAGTRTPMTPPVRPQPREQSPRPVNASSPTVADSVKTVEPQLPQGSPPSAPSPPVVQPHSTAATIAPESTPDSNAVLASVVKPTPPPPSVISAPPPPKLSVNLPTEAGAVRLLAPRIIRQVIPAVPLGIAPRLRGEVQIDVSVSVDIDGKVTGARVVQSEGSGASLLAIEALKAAQLSRFLPAQQDGKPVAGTLVVTFRFAPKN